MADNRDISPRVLLAQAAMFRLAARDYGLSRTRLSLETGIAESTLKSWANGTAMPVCGFAKLARIIPDALTSLLVEPAGKHIGTNEGGDGDLDALGRECAGLVSEKLDREADGVLCHIDRAALRGRARRVGAAARAVAA